MGSFLFLVFINYLSQAISDGYNNINTDTSDFAIYVNNERLEEVKSALYLGLEIDSLLTSDVHVKRLSIIISIESCYTQ